MQLPELILYVPYPDGVPRFADGGPALSPIRDGLGALVTPPLVAVNVAQRLPDGAGCYGPDLMICANVRLSVTDLDLAESIVRRVTSGTTYEGRFGVCRLTHGSEEPATSRLFRALQVIYRVDDIPGALSLSDTLAFRNAAMDHIERALLAADAGEWIGAEAGHDPLCGSAVASLGFEVHDLDEAEELIRRAVAGTPYAPILRIDRREIETEDLV